MNILAVISAYGEIKGIPRKDMRLMAGKPLVYYAIHNAQTCEMITDIVVSSNDNGVIHFAEECGVDTLQCSTEQIEDALTLQSIVYDAVSQMEYLKNRNYDIVIILQSNTPVLQVKTLQEAVSDFINEKKDTSISVVNRLSLKWEESEEKCYSLYEKEWNFQQFTPHYLEVSAFLITRREFVVRNNYMGEKVSMYEIPEVEAVDIASVFDWIVCENIFRRKKIVFRADGYQKIGMGHIYHCLTLAYNLLGHEIMFVTKEGCKEGIQKLKESSLPYKIVKDDEAFFDYVKVYNPDVIVNDCLDTTAPYIKKLKQLCRRVVTIEDMGEGTQYADSVINALYKGKKNQGYHVYSGENYICLRDEFLISKPKKFSSQVKEVLVLFGGTDPSNLTSVIYRLAKKMYEKYPQIHFTFLAGIGYDCEKHGIFSRENENISVIQNTSSVSAYMKQADMAFTSQGRTVFEFAVMGVPAIVLAQNEREQLHTFAQMENGFLNLGLGSRIEFDTIERAFEFLVNTPQMREEMRRLMLRHEQQLKSGVQREVSLILGE